MSETQRNALDFVVGPIADLDGYYLQYQIWTRELDTEDVENGVVCQAFDNEDREIGKLAIDGNGKILIVEVDEGHRRIGIATQMLTELRSAGYRVEHDWDNMRGDGAAWARGVESRKP